MRKTLAALAHFALAFTVTSHLAVPAQSSNRNGESADSSCQQSVKQGPCGGGIVNRLAVSMPAPVYPPKARAARATGRVFVQVQINEEGKVISARVCSGPATLRQAALDAAYKARFSPTLLAGKPVKVSGVLIYTFTLR